MNILAVFAHPDDETMLSGGVLALLARQGHQVHYLSATRGEGGEVGEPPLCEREQLGELREQELVCAVRALGGISLTFLGYVDPTVGSDDTMYSHTDDLIMIAGQIATSIRQFAIQAVITHGSNGEYGHPAHKTTHLAARLAVEPLGELAPLLYTIAADYPDFPRKRLANKSDPAHLVLDITPALAQKQAAALCHRSQHALFVRRRSQELGRQLSVPEVVMTVESLHRAYPLVAGPLDDPLAQALAPYRHV